MEKGSSSITLIGAGAAFEGKINTPHTVQIFGKFDGEIISSDTITIGREGVVRAEITAKSAQIGGKVFGNISCRDGRIELEEKSEVKGNIVAKELVIKKGAKFHGNSDMSINKNAKQEEFPDNNSVIKDASAKKGKEGK